MHNQNLLQLATLGHGRTGRCSSWDVSGRNGDRWVIPARTSRVLADIKGPGVISHIWMTQSRNDREWILHVGHDGGARVFVDGKPETDIPALMKE